MCAIYFVLTETTGEQKKQTFPSLRWYSNLSFWRQKSHLITHGVPNPPWGIKINFLFYPWSARPRRGLELQAWKRFCRLRYTTKHPAQLMYGNWQLLHMPPGSHLRHRHISLTGRGAKPGGGRKKSSLSVNGSSKKGKRPDGETCYILPRCHESSWMGPPPSP